nr:MAG TPA: hypothetical protein [Caudoviricetes sp.]
MTVEMKALIQAENELAKNYEFLRIAQLKLCDAKRCCKTEAVAYWTKRITRLEGAIDALEPIKKILMEV